MNAGSKLPDYWETRTMARPKQSPPTYQLHKRSGQARTAINGRDFYLGPYGSDESRRRFGELIAKVASGMPIVDPLGKPEASDPADPGPSVNELCLSFWAHAEKHYVKDGEETSELHCFRSCLRIRRELYGMIPAKDFGPLAFKAVRAKMVSGDPDAVDSDGEPAPRKPWVRKNVNRMMSRIRQVFKHGIENEMIYADVLARLQAVAPLLANKCDALDNAPPRGGRPKQG